MLHESDMMLTVSEQFHMLCPRFASSGISDAVMSESLRGYSMSLPFQCREGRGASPEPDHTGHRPFPETGNGVGD
jgi:hypothetical protein